MRIFHGLSVLTAAFVQMLVGSAFATTSAVELEYVQRNMVLPDGVLRFDAGHRWPYYDAQFKHVVLRGGPDLDFLNPGLTFGLAEDLELGLVAPLRLSPDFDVEDPRLHALYQFLEGDVDVGLFSSLRLGFFDQWRLVGGVPIQWDLSSTIRLDTGGFLELVFGDGSTVNVIVPVQVPIQLSRRLYLGPETGIELRSVFDDGSNVALPLGGFVGYSFGSGGGTIGDIYARMRLLDLEQGFDVVELMLGTELFFDM